ncbi:hypothetical protein [Rossellomorea sp. KS-H15a]|uniref:hypothetical protein n=1 Tax=Rossellomorea sp. KS-H15a TaxID=2963940 RepID=UPI0020C6BD2B|nr:hypothetical protein [Rossellomorea sp. KS-H15a]UTE77219.1 hypothetical protein M1J35_22370 [Rossellomorea sp. KS-H15a]
MRIVFKHCTIKGLSSDSVKFYDKESKGLFRAFHELEVSMATVRTNKTEEVENWIEYMLKNIRATSSINAYMRAGITFFNFCLKKNWNKLGPQKNENRTLI